MSSGTPRVIDVHTHAVPVDLPSIEDPLWPAMAVDGPETRRLIFRDGSKRSLTPTSWDPQARVADMDQLGVARHIVSPMPALLADVVTSPRSGEWVANAINEAVGQFVASAPERFGGFGTLPVAPRQRVLGRIARGLDEFDLDGFEISTDGLSRFIEEGIWPDVFRAIDEAGAWVFIHPHDHTVARRRNLVGRLTVAGIGMTAETAIAAVELMRSAVLGEHSRVLLGHGGGVLPYLLPRLDSLWRDTVARSELPIPPSEAFAHSFFVDSCVHGTTSLRCVASVVRPERLLYGSDYPFALHVPAEHVRDTFEETKAEGILATNAKVAGFMRPRVAE